MKPAPKAARDLLHTIGQGALGTLLADGGGQPFVSAIQFAPDPDNAPVFLVSRLAEHTRNLERDPRASLLLQDDADEGEGGVLAQSRMTIVGDARRIDPEPALVTRFLRYLPEAGRYLELGDFGFFRLQTVRARLIGGFGSMGWLEGASLAPPAPLALDLEAQILASCSTRIAPGLHLLGVDREGVDLVRDGRRERRHFPRTLEDDDSVAAVADLIAGL